MLTEKISAEAYEALDPVEQGHYRKSGTGYVLETDGSSTLDKALKAERRLREAGDRMLGRLVPSLVDESRDDGLINRRQWRGHVDERVDLLADLEGDEGQDPVDLDDVRRWRDRPTGEDGEEDESALRTELTQAQKDLREARRDLRTATRDKDEAETRSTTLEEENLELVQERDITSMLDGINITSPFKRKMARRWLAAEGLTVLDGETLIHVDGADIPLTEYGPEWAETDEGKEFVAATDSSGGGDGGEPPLPRRQRPGAPAGGEGDERIRPMEKLTKAFADRDQGAGAS